MDVYGRSHDCPEALMRSGKLGVLNYKDNINNNLLGQTNF